MVQIDSETGGGAGLGLTQERFESRISVTESHLELLEARIRFIDTKVNTIGFIVTCTAGIVILAILVVFLIPRIGEFAILAALVLLILLGWGSNKYWNEISGIGDNE